MPTFNHWIIAAGVLMQFALGAVYAWSVFRIPLTRTYRWTISEVTFAFIMSGLSIVTMPIDIFPYINVPMVGV
jgi:hypothetical protein